MEKELSNDNKKEFQTIFQNLVRLITKNKPSSRKEVKDAQRSNLEELLTRLIDLGLKKDYFDCRIELKTDETHNEKIGDGDFDERLLDKKIGLVEGLDRRSTGRVSPGDESDYSKKLLTLFSEWKNGKDSEFAEELLHQVPLNGIGGGGDCSL